MSNIARQNTTTPGTVPAHALRGDPVGGNTIQAMSGPNGGNVQPLHSPAMRGPNDPKPTKYCVEPGCGGYRTKYDGYCAGHARSKGLVNWSGKKKGVTHDDTDADRPEKLGSDADADTPDGTT